MLHLSETSGRSLLQNIGMFVLLMSWQRWSKGMFNLLHSQLMMYNILHTNMVCWMMVFNDIQAPRRIQYYSARYNRSDQLEQQLSSFLQQIRIRKVSSLVQKLDFWHHIQDDICYDVDIDIVKDNTKIGLTISTPLLLNKSLWIMFYLKQVKWVSYKI